MTKKWLKFVVLAVVLVVTFISGTYFNRMRDFVNAKRDFQKDQDAYFNDEVKILVIIAFLEDCVIESDEVHFEEAEKIVASKFGTTWDFLPLIKGKLAGHHGYVFQLSPRQIRQTIE